MRAPPPQLNIHRYAPQITDSGPAKQRTRILLVDDHPLVRERLAEIINREADLIVCGEAEDRHEATAAILAKRPDLASST